MIGIPCLFACSFIEAVPVPPGKASRKSTPIDFPILAISLFRNGPATRPHEFHSASTFL